MYYRHVLTFSVDHGKGQDESTIHMLAKHYVQAYTLTVVAGMWQGIQEKSWQLEVIGDNDSHTRDNLRRFAESIKLYCSQDAVLYYGHAINGEMI